MLQTFFSFMSKTETLYKQELHAMHSYTRLAVPVQTTVADSQCKKLVASTQLAIFLSQNVVFNTSIVLLWKLRSIKLLIFYVRHLDHFCSLQ